MRWLGRLPVAITISSIALVISLIGVTIDYFTTVYMDNCLIVSSTQLLERRIDEDTTIGVGHLPIPSQGAQKVYVSDLLLSNAGNRPILVDGVHFSLRKQQDENDASHKIIILNPTGPYVDTYIDDTQTSFVLPEPLYLAPGEVRSIRLKSLFDRSSYHHYRGGTYVIEVHLNVYNSSLARSSLGFPLAETTFARDGFPGYPQRIAQAENPKRHRWEDSRSQGILGNLNGVVADVFSQCDANRPETDR